MAREYVVPSLPTFSPSAGVFIQMMPRRNACTMNISRRRREICSTIADF
ncbi:MAG: hypothetical protein ACXW5U_13815 [Thermoanaerobaculia bacterium]